MRTQMTQVFSAAGVALSAALLLTSPPAMGGTILPTPVNILPFVPLTASPSPITLVEGNSTQLVYTFTDNTATGIYLNVFKAVNTTNPKSCGADCPTSTLLDQQFHLIGPGQSYSYIVPIISTLDVDTGSETSSVSNSVVQGTIWWEYNLPGRGQLIYKQSTKVKVAVVEPSAASPTLASLASPSAVPEPTSWAMILIGFAGLGTTLRSRRQATKKLA
jgi:hypothetical protein